MNRWLPTIGVILVAVGCFALKIKIEPKVHGFSSRPNLKPVEASYQGASLKRLSPGMDSFISALLWVQLLQQASYKKLAPNEVSWEFAQLDAIGKLEPRFERAYEFGHAFLSVFRRDRLGAKLILERWTKIKPTDWKPRYLYGYHLYYELNDHKAASEALLKASQMSNAPGWLAGLGVRLLEQDFAIEQALSVAVDLYSQTNNPVARERLRLRIRSIRFSQEKQRWEKAILAFKKRNRKFPKQLSAAAPFLEPVTHRMLASIKVDSDVADELAYLLNEKHEFSYDGSGRIEASGKSIEVAADRLGIFPSRE